MSERGSFVSEYVYCKKCFAAAWGLFQSHDKYLMATRIPAWGDNGTVQIDGEVSTVLPIIAGKVGSLRPGGEFDAIEEILTQLEAQVCQGHSIRFAVLSESEGQRMYDVTTDGWSVAGACV